MYSRPSKVCHTQIRNLGYMGLGGHGEQGGNVCNWAGDEPLFLVVFRTVDDAEK